MLVPACIQQYAVSCMHFIHQTHYSFYRCNWEKKRLCPCCSPPTTQSHKYYSQPCPWGVSFAWATGVRRDTHSPLLLYMLWKCEHGSVVVVCLAWGLACTFILSLHEHRCWSFIEHGSMSSSATLKNEHRRVGCVFIICP